MKTTPRKPSCCLDFKNKEKIRQNKKNYREKSKIAENQVFWLDFCAKKRTVHTPSGKEIAYNPEEEG
jgi:hypothetical protein